MCKNYRLCDSESVDRIIYVARPSEGTFALKSNRNFVVDACGASVLYGPLCQVHTGIICDSTAFPSKFSIITNGFDT